MLAFLFKKSWVILNVQLYIVSALSNEVQSKSFDELIRKTIIIPKRIVFFFICKLGFFLFFHASLKQFKVTLLMCFMRFVNYIFFFLLILVGCSFVGNV